jgi:hypothetical protein
LTKGARRIADGSGAAFRHGQPKIADSFFDRAFLVFFLCGLHAITKEATTLSQMIECPAKKVRLQRFVKGGGAKNVWKRLLGLRERS